jgi:hypothetical protein
MSRWNFRSPTGLSRATDNSKLFGKGIIRVQIRDAVTHESHSFGKPFFG